MFFLLHYDQYNAIKGKQELILQWSNFWLSEIMETAQAVESLIIFAPYDGDGQPVKC